MRRKTIAAAVVMAMTCSPAISPAFQQIEEIQWPESGRYPAYPPEEPDGRNVRANVFTGVMHDSNLFRLSDSVDPATIIGDTHKSDTIFRYGAGLKADIPVSRQHILFDAQVERRDFNRFDFLNHNAYRVGLGLRWQAGPQWSGEFGYGRRQFLASLAELQAPVRDMITEDHAYAGGGIRVTPRWRLRGVLDAFKWEHGDPTRTTLDNTLYSATGGIDYMTPADNSLGWQIKFSHGDYPNREVVAGSTVDNSFNEYEISGVAHWIVTGKSTLDARLGYTNRYHDQLPQRDFDGMTGRLGYDYFIGSKTILNFAVWREIRSIEDVSASYVLSTGWGVGPSWAPTSKLVFQTKYVREDRDYKGDPGFALGGTLQQREDTFRGITFGGGYSPRRNIELAVGAEYGKRTSNIVARDYDYNAVMANARLRF